MTAQNEFRKKLKAYFGMRRMSFKVRMAKDSNVVEVLKWPSMQGQGVLAAAYMEERWAKLVEFGKQNGFQIVRANRS